MEFIHVASELPSLVIFWPKEFIKFNPNHDPATGGFSSGGGGFSINGGGGDATAADLSRLPVAARTEAVRKDNPNHDELGRFASGPSGGGGVADPLQEIASISFTRASPEEFIAARSQSKHPGYLSPLEPSDLEHSEIYLGANGTVGVAVTNGDIGNVFNNGGPRGAGAVAVATAIDHGGRTLDAFDGFLPRFYGQLGFRETGRMKFDPAQAPPSWNSAEDDHPDVVFMAWQGYTGGRTVAINRAADRNSADRLPVMPSGNYYDDFAQAKADAARMAKRRVVKLGKVKPPAMVEGIDWSNYTDGEREVLEDVAKDRGNAWVDAHATMILNQARLIGELPEKEIVT